MSTVMTRDLEAERATREWSDFLAAWNERRAREKAALTVAGDGDGSQPSDSGDRQRPRKRRVAR